MSNRQNNTAPKKGKKTHTYSVTGYKAFMNTAVQSSDKKAPVLKDFTCRDYHFKIGNEYEWLSKENEGKDIEIGLRGFHFCTQPGFIRTYYNFVDDHSILFAEVLATGRVLTDWNPETDHYDPHVIRGDKFVTDRIKLVREIPRDEFLALCNGEHKSLDGTIVRYKNGNVHSNEGPAIERPDGSKEWYDRGRLHNAKGPAQTWIDGHSCWWYNGERHCETGPAVKWPSGHMEYYEHGQLHRAGGPAVILVSGAQYYYTRGKQISCA